MNIIEEAFGKLESKDIKREDNEAYNKGLEDGKNEVWELTKKLVLLDSSIGWEIFGTCRVLEVLENFTPQEALAKLEAYEKEQEIKVGDVVEATDLFGDVFKGTVLDFKDGAETEVFVFDENGCVDVWEIADCKKTGKHIDIQSVREQIRGAE